MLLADLVRVLERAGVEPRALALAWARVAPSTLLIPAFGLRALPLPARITLGLSLALGVAPALGGVTSSSAWPIALGIEAARGIPVALAASVSLYAASMAGGLVDDLRGSRERSELPNVESGTSPTGALLSMLVAIAFLEGGGPARVARALTRQDVLLTSAFARAAQDLASGVELAVSVAAPVLVSSIVIEVAGALVARAASPAFIAPLLAPLRSLALLGVSALVLERMVELLVIAGAR